jgi:flagellar biosynthetic protein FliO
LDWLEILSMIGTVVLMIAVFVGAYYVSRFVGKKYQPRNGTSRNISILESQPVGKDRALIVVKAANKAFLVGATPHEFTLISELNPDDLSDLPESKPSKKDFSSVFRSVIMGGDKKQNGGESE